MTKPSWVPGQKRRLTRSDSVPSFLRSAPGIKAPRVSGESERDHGYESHHDERPIPNPYAIAIPDSDSDDDEERAWQRIDMLSEPGVLIMNTYEVERIAGQGTYGRVILINLLKC